MRARLLTMVAILAVFALACGRGSTGEPGLAEPVSSSGAGLTTTAMGPGISIKEARTSNLESPLLVNGFLVLTNEKAEFCEDFTSEAGRSSR